MKRILKDIWFYIKDFFTKTLMYGVYIVVAFFTMRFIFSTYELIIELAGYRPLFDGKPVFTEKELDDRYFIVRHFAFLIGGLSLCSDLYILVNWTWKKLFGQPSDVFVDGVSRK